MSDSIRDRFLKEHELSMEDLEKVTGGWGDAGYETQPIICPECGQNFYALVDFGYLTDISCPACDWSHDDVSLEASGYSFYPDMFK